MSDQTSPHVIPLKVYLGIGATLMVFTLITVLAVQIDLGFFNIILALAIATTKALLVAFFFMHLYYDNKMLFFIFATSIFFLSVLISLTLADTLRRGDIYEYRNTNIEQNAIIYDGTSTAGADTSGAGH